MHCSIGAPRSPSAATSLPDLLCSRQQYCVCCHWVLPRAMVPRQQAGGLHRGSAGRVRRAPRGQYGAVCSFAVSQQWDPVVGGPPGCRRWELPFRSGFPGDCIAIVLCLVFTLYSMPAKWGKIAKVADDHNSLETGKLVEERKTDGTNFKRKRPTDEKKKKKP